ncbi:hypothetical protein SKAU_G00059070 [Synaphobranchus kaupii]|uniref:Uncharacterized protein n=1 Tax=Synaphobranchus kaupii TaxID=118154 RepID=A0A9Q1G5J7_SYNKA|nr:hypothetical protein SKAU_G00059070 [Synaphobranchus kaupii]
MTFREWKAQVQAMLRAQALTEDQQVDFVLGALEGTARREVRLLGEWQTIDAVWEELDGQWREQEPGGDEENDILLRDQFFLGLEDGQVRRQDSLTFHQVTTEPPVQPEVDLEQWEEEVKNELRQELQDQLAALGRTLVAELRQQCAPPGALRPGELIITIRMLPFQISTPSLIGGTSEEGPSVWSVEVRDMCSGGAHSPPSCGSVKRQPPATMHGGRDMVLQTPNPREVVINVWTTQAPAGAGSPLDLPEAGELTPD